MNNPKNRTMRKNSTKSNIPNNKLPDIKKEILAKRTKQSQIFNQIKDDIKKIRETNLSVIGLEQLGPNSIKKMQDRRKNSLKQLNSNVQVLNALLKTITALETKYKQNISN